MKRNQHRHAGLFLGILLFAFLAAGSAHADGKFFRRTTIADEPGIQTQRALIVFRDRMQTLFVQSDLSNAGHDIGWLLPLPSEPTAIEACPANTLHGLAAIVRPRVVESHWGPLLASIVLLLLFLAAGEDHLAQGPSFFAPWRVLVLLVVLFFAASLLLPSLGTAGGGGSGVSVVRTKQAGIYDTTVLRGTDAQGVADWLQSSGFAVSDAARSVIGDYIDAGWCFLAARVSAKVTGDVTQHPLKVTFPAAEPIYPMRLTGVDAEPIVLDLFVIAEQRAAVPNLQTWTCNTYRQTTYDPVPFTRNGFACDVPPVFRGLGHIGLPAVSPLMWDGCVLTRLHARLRPRQMRADLPVHLQPYQPHRARLQSRQAAITGSSAVAMIAAGLALAGLLGIAKQRGWSLPVLLYRRGWIPVVVAVLAGGVCLMVYARAGVVRIDPEDRFPWQRVRAHEIALTQLHTEPPTAAYPEAYRAELARWLSELAVTEDGHSDLPSMEQTDPQRPGEYRLEQVEAGWRLTVIDSNLVTVTVPIWPDGRLTGGGEREPRE